MKFYYLSALVGLFLVSSCAQNSADANLDLQEKVISVHDDVMPLMGEFVRNSIKIDSILNNMDQVLKDDPSADTAQVKIDLLKLKVNLDNAVEGMNDWMHNFEMDNEGQSKDEVKKYLENELITIENVKKKFNDAGLESVVILKGY